MNDWTPFGTTLYGVGMALPYTASAGLLLLLTLFVFANPGLRRATNTTV